MAFGQVLISCRSSPSKNHTADEGFPKELDFKDITFSLKIRNIYKIKNSIAISIFDYENKEKYPIYVSSSTNSMKFKLMSDMPLDKR